MRCKHLHSLSIGLVKVRKNLKEVHIHVFWICTRVWFVVVDMYMPCTYFEVIVSFGMMLAVISYPARMSMEACLFETLAWKTSKTLMVVTWLARLYWHWNNHIVFQHNFYYYSYSDFFSISSCALPLNLSLAINYTCGLDKKQNAYTQTLLLSGKNKIDMSALTVLEEFSWPKHLIYAKLHVVYVKAAGYVLFRNIDIFDISLTNR